MPMPQIAISVSSEAQRRQQIEKMQAEIRSLQNQRDFVEILVQFWPWNNMATRLQRLENEVEQIELKIRQLQLAPGAKKPIPLKFPRFDVSTAWVTPEKHRRYGA
jgi:hypothetical protein